MAKERSGNASICRAIEQRRVIQFSYGGLFRVVEPFSYGFTAAGKEILRGFQVEGQSRSGDAPAWRAFSVAAIEDLEIREEHFDANRPEYKPADPAIVDFLARVDADTGAARAQTVGDSAQTLVDGG